MEKKVKVLVPATTANLGSGFDCLGMALDLYNSFEFELGIEGFSVQGEGRQQLELDGGRLVYEAWDAAFNFANVPPPTVALHIESKIPLGRGLGSSATAVVAGVCGANILGGLQLATAELISIASVIEGHSDNVAPALLGGLVVSAVWKNEVDYIVLDPADTLQVVVAVPDFELSTERARSVLPDMVSRADAVFNTSRAALFVAAWTQKKWELLGRAMEDRLHQPFRGSLVPGLNQVVEAAMAAGALGSALSGAGPSVVALTAGGHRAVGQVMQQAFAQHGIDCRILVTRSVGQGAHLAI